MIFVFQIRNIIYIRVKEYLLEFVKTSVTIAANLCVPNNNALGDALSNDFDSDDWLGRQIRLRLISY